MSDTPLRAEHPSFDAVSYWCHRHEQYRNSLRSVGCRSFRDSANRWFYRRVSDVYDDLLSGLPLPPGARVLDAGAGIGMYIPLFLKRQWQVTANDVSVTALEALKEKFPAVETIAGDIAKLPFPDWSYSLVHCFDVLYHVVEESQWRRAIAELCRVSARYVIIHGPWLTQRAKTLSHLRQDSARQYRRAFEAEGFVERCVVPTLFAFRFPWYYLRNAWPSLWSAIDRRLAEKRMDDSELQGAQVITVFERQTKPAA